MSESSIRVAKAKSAFKFFQSEHLSEVKRQLGVNATMGSAMNEVCLFICLLVCLLVGLLVYIMEVEKIVL